MVPSSSKAYGLWTVAVQLEQEQQRHLAGEGRSLILNQSVISLTEVSYFLVLGGSIFILWRRLEAHQLGNLQMTSHPRVRPGVQDAVIHTSQHLGGRGWRIGSQGQP